MKPGDYASKISEPDRRINFEHLVLRGIWCVCYAIMLKNRPHNWVFTLLMDWRHDVLSYMDIFGNQSDGAPDYRRTRTFPELPKE